MAHPDVVETQYGPDANDHPVLFAGRHEISAPAMVVINDPLPRALLSRAPSHWIVADPWLFPFEHLTDRQLDAPIDVVLTTTIDEPGIVSTLSAGLFGALGAYDTVACDPQTWERLARRFGWNASQWRSPAASLLETVDGLRRGSTSVTASSFTAGTAVDEQVGSTSPPDSDLRTRSNKARLRAESDALVPELHRALGQAVTGTRIHVAEFGSDAGRYLPIVRSVDGSAALTVTALRTDASVAAQVRENQPDLDVVTVGAGLATALTPESVDVVLMTVDEFAFDEIQRRTVQRQILEALRVGGTLLIVHRLDGLAKVSLSRRLADLSANVGQQLTRESVVSVKNPQSGRSDTAVTSLTKIGNPRRW